jgi:hypothetical protein
MEYGHRQPGVGDQICHPSFAGQLRHTDNSDAPWPQRCKDYDDIYPLRTEQDRKRGKEPAGFLIASLHILFYRTLFHFRQATAFIVQQLLAAIERSL